MSATKSNPASVPGVASSTIVAAATALSPTAAAVAAGDMRSPRVNDPGIFPDMPPSDLNTLWKKDLKEIRSLCSLKQLAVEEKKKELQELVGKRYQKLSESAKSVIAMDTSSQNLLRHLERTKEYMDLLEIKFNPAARLSGTVTGASPGTATPLGSLSDSALTSGTSEDGSTQSSLARTNQKRLAKSNLVKHVKLVTKRGLKLFQLLLEYQLTLAPGFATKEQYELNIEEFMAGDIGSCDKPTGRLSLRFITKAFIRTLSMLHAVLTDQSLDQCFAGANGEDVSQDPDIMILIEGLRESMCWLGQIAYAIVALSNEALSKPSLPVASHVDACSARIALGVVQWTSDRCATLGALSPTPMAGDESTSSRQQTQARITTLTRLARKVPLYIPWNYQAASVQRDAEGNDATSTLSGRGVSEPASGMSGPSAASNDPPALTALMDVLQARQTALIMLLNAAANAPETESNSSNFVPSTMASFTTVFCKTVKDVASMVSSIDYDDDTMSVESPTSNIAAFKRTAMPSAQGLDLVSALGETLEPSEVAAAAALLEPGLYQSLQRLAHISEKVIPTQDDAVVVTGWALRQDFVALQTYTRKWLKALRNGIAPAISTLFSRIRSLTALARVRDAIASRIPQSRINYERQGIGLVSSVQPLQETGWFAACRMLFARPLAVFDEFFRESYHTVAKSLIERSFHDFQSRTVSRLALAIDTVNLLSPHSWLIQGSLLQQLAELSNSAPNPSDNIDDSNMKLCARALPVVAALPESARNLFLAAEESDPSVLLAYLEHTRAMQSEARKRVRRMGTDGSDAKSARKVDGTQSTGPATPVSESFEDTFETESLLADFLKQIRRKYAENENVNPPSLAERFFNALVSRKRSLLRSAKVKFETLGQPFVRALIRSLVNSGGQSSEVHCMADPQLAGDTESTNVNVPRAWINAGQSHLANHSLATQSLTSIYHYMQQVTKQTGPKTCERLTPQPAEAIVESALVKIIARAARGFAPIKKGVTRNQSGLTAMRAYQWSEKVCRNGGTGSDAGGWLENNKGARNSNPCAQAIADLVVAAVNSDLDYLCRSVYAILEPVILNAVREAKAAQDVINVSCSLARQVDYHWLRTWNFIELFLIQAQNVIDAELDDVSLLLRSASDAIRQKVLSAVTSGVASVEQSPDGAVLGGPCDATAAGTVLARSVEGLFCHSPAAAILTCLASLPQAAAVERGGVKSVLEHIVRAAEGIDVAKVTARVRLPSLLAILGRLERVSAFCSRGAAGTPSKEHVSVTPDQVLLSAAQIPKSFQPLRDIALSISTNRFLSVCLSTTITKLLTRSIKPTTSKEELFICANSKFSSLRPSPIVFIADEGIARTLSRVLVVEECAQQYELMMTIPDQVEENVTTPLLPFSSRRVCAHALTTALRASLRCHLLEARRILSKLVTGEAPSIPALESYPSAQTLLDILLIFDRLDLPVDSESSVGDEDGEDEDEAYYLALKVGEFTQLVSSLIASAVVVMHSFARKHGMPILGIKELVLTVCGRVIENAKSLSSRRDTRFNLHDELRAAANALLLTLRLEPFRALSIKETSLAAVRTNVMSLSDSMICQQPQQFIPSEILDFIDTNQIPHWIPFIDACVAMGVSHSELIRQVSQSGHASEGSLSHTSGDIQAKYRSEYQPSPDKHRDMPEMTAQSYHEQQNLTALDSSHKRHSSGRSEPQPDIVAEVPLYRPSTQATKQGREASMPLAAALTAVATNVTAATIKSRVDETKATAAAAAASAAAKAASFWESMTSSVGSSLSSLSSRVLAGHIDSVETTSKDTEGAKSDGTSSRRSSSSQVPQ